MQKHPLPPDKVRSALQRIHAWRAAPAAPVACPVCEAEGLKIVDQSARPYAEWYALTCPACGLEATINLPMAPGIPGASDP
jgi:hypothetical protein